MNKTPNNEEIEFESIDSFFAGLSMKDEKNAVVQGARLSNLKPMRKIEQLFDE